MSVISKLYQNLRVTIDDINTGDLKKLEGHVSVIYESFTDLRYIIQPASISDLEDYLQWNYLISNVIYVNYAFDYKDDEAYDLFFLDEFASLMARKLAQDETNQFFSLIWESLIIQDTLRICVPEETKIEANALY